MRQTAGALIFARFGVAFHHAVNVGVAAALAKDPWSNENHTPFPDRILLSAVRDEQRVSIWPREKDCVYSTLEGAKARAKSLKRLFADSGIHFSLHQSQLALARAGGFQDWHDLQANLQTDGRTVDADVYRRRLKAALPLACHGPLLASWGPDPEPAEDVGDGIPVHFFRDVWPYVMAAEVLHRTRTTLIRPGSGVGQKLRAAMVSGVLLNIHGGLQSTPTLEPETLALDCPGDLATVFRDEAAHPRFAQELATLTEAGVIAVLDDRSRGPIVRILAPPGLQHEVVR